MSKVRIQLIQAYELIDSRANPTVAVKVFLSDGSSGFSMVPSGASTGMHEAHEKRDGDESRYLGKGVLGALEVISSDINSILSGMDAYDLYKIDSLMCTEDGTDNKSNFGANSILGVSMACARAAANSLNVPLYKHFNNIYKSINDKAPQMNLPIPMLNILNGGAHADNPIDFQEFMVQPLGFKTFAESLRAGIEIFHQLKSSLKKKKLSISVGDEGGFAPNLNSAEDALDLIVGAIEGAGYLPKKDVAITLDVASSEFFKNSNYVLEGMEETFSSSELINYLETLVDKYPISSIEDGLDENDWDGWKEITSSLGDKIQLVGDDLFVTNSAILRKGIDMGAANSILIKVNQIGSITETLETIKLASDNNYKSVISHRSGETEDSLIADLSVGTGVGQIKTGAPSRSERVSKYNRLLTIEHDEDFIFAGCN
tara:strand:- start:5330 stop:6619 length:1290 start_codon:yes stop_codon:yes gene_type:complete